MICTFIRSSSYNSFSMCEQQYLLEYVLGIEKPSNPAMDRGTIVHKALEVLAHVSFCRRDGVESYDDDAFGVVRVADVTPEWAVDRSWEYYVPMSPHIEWKPADLKECKKLMRKAIDFNGGQYDPRNLDVVQPEGRFDFEIDRPWARYEYDMPDGTRLEGRLGMKGTIDLVARSRLSPKVLEIVDWKTGSRNDWGREPIIYPTGRREYYKKTYDDLRRDPQLSLYHYAASHIYPEADEIFVTIFYVKDGGPYSLCFGRDDVARTEEMIRERFEEIKSVRIPHLNKGMKCTSFCHYGKTMSQQDPGKTICQFIHDKVVRDGLEDVVQEFGKDRHYQKYGSGGGRRDAE